MVLFMVKNKVLKLFLIYLFFW